MKEEEVEEEPAAPVSKQREIPTQDAVAGSDDGFSAVGKGGKAIVSVTSENLLTRLREVLESRGKKVRKQICSRKWYTKLSKHVYFRTPTAMNKLLLWKLYWKVPNLLSKRFLFC